MNNLFKPIFGPKTKPPLGARVNPSHPLASKLEVCYLMNEAGGSKLNNCANGKYPGSITGMAAGKTSWLAGKTGPSLKNIAGGTTQGVTLTGPTNSGTTFTIECWVYLQGGTGYGSIWAANGGQGLYISTAFMQFWPSTTSTATFVSNRWYHCVFSVNNGTGTYYVNGVAAGTATGVTTFSSINTMLNDSSTENFVGQIELLRHWSGRALSQGEVFDLYVNPYGMFQAPYSPIINPGLIGTIQPTVNSVQSGSITLTGATNTATLPIGVGANAFVVMTGWTTSIATTAIGTNLPYVQLSGNVVTATRSGTSSTITVFYTVIDPGLNLVDLVQQGTITISSGTSNTATLTTPVDVTRSVCFYQGNSSTQTSTASNQYKTGCTLTNTNTVTAAAGVTGSTTTTAYVVVQFAPGVVKSLQQFAVTHAWGAATSYTQAISAVTMANTFIANGGFNNDTSSVSSSSLTQRDLTSTTVVTLTRQGTTSFNTTDYYTVVEFNAGVLASSVQRGDITVSGTSSTATLSPAVVAAASFANYTGHSTNAASNGGSTWADLTLTNSTTVTAARANSTSGNVVVSWESLEFVLASVAYTGTFAATQALDAMVAVGKETFTGAFAATQAKDVMAASGKETMTGAFAATQAKDTIAASGAFQVMGTFAATQAPDTMAAVGKETFTGAFAATQAKDSMAATGAETMAGTLSVTQNVDVMAASGNETFTGTLSVTQALDVMVAAGSFGGTFGTFAATQNKDVMAASGKETFTGTLAATQQRDTMIATGAFAPVGPFAATQNPDTMAAAGKETMTGTMATTQAKDIMVAAGLERMTGTFSVTQAKDTMSATGRETMTGALAVTQNKDTMISAGKETILGAFAVTQNKDIMVATGQETFAGMFAAIQNRDTMQATGKQTFTGIFAAIQAMDYMNAMGISLRTNNLIRLRHKRRVLSPDPKSATLQTKHRNRMI